MRIAPTYRKPLVIAVLLHLVLVMLLIVTLPSRSYRYDSGHNKAKIVHATAVTANQVQQAMHAIQNRENAKRRAQAHQLALLEKQTQIQKQHQAQAIKRVAKMKQEQLVLKHQHDQQIKALAELKQHQLKLTRKTQRHKAQLQKAKALALQKRRKQLIAQQEALQKKLLAQQLAGDTNQVKTIQTRQMQGIVDKYKAMILSVIGSNWLVPGGVNKTLSSVFEVQLAPGGMVISVQLVKSSGNQALDQSAKTAIYKSSPLPVPKDPMAFDNFRDLRLTVSPEEVIRSQT